MGRIIKFRAWWDDGNQQEMLYVGDRCGTSHDLDCCKYFIEGQPVTLMQYTGLNDKKGIEIYEGDIIEWCDSRWQIVWEASDASFFAESLYGCGYESGQEWGNDCMVVGNIYEKPELLEEKE